MGLSRLGNFIEAVDDRNDDLEFGPDQLRGISINKVFMPTKADTGDLNLRNYKIVRHNQFAYCNVTSRNGGKISLAFNDSDDCIVSSVNPVFKIKDETRLLPKFLMMFFNRSEFDRYARFHSWGSARETFSWEDFCNVELDIPPIEIQKKYVAIYEGLLSNLRSYERGLEDLKLVCDGYIEDLRRTQPCEEIGKYLSENTESNEDETALILGISKDGFIPPKQKTGDERKYTLFKKDDFVYSPPRINVGSIGLYKGEEICACSPIYVAFSIKNKKALVPEYLMLWFKRSEFLRSTDFYSIASVRNNFSFELMKRVKIPIPDPSIQRSIADIYNVYIKRQEIGEKLKEHINGLCPILVKGAIEEGKNTSTMNAFLHSDHIINSGGGSNA